MNTLLAMVQGIAGSLSLPVPSSLVGNADAASVLWLNLAKREGRELARRHDWQALIVQKTFTSTATVVQSSALGTDYDHMVPDVEIWDQTNHQVLVGPTSSVNWVRLQSSAVTGSIAGWWRILGGALNVYPAPTAGHTFALDYISKNWCQSSGGTAQSTWAADTDTPLIPDHLIELGITWRWLRVKSMHYAEEMATYERELEKAASRDRGMRVLYVSKSRDDDYPPQPGWTGTVG
jgi:hypothetical protein